MHPSRSLGRSAFVLLVGLNLTACAAAATPTLAPSVPSSSPSAGASAGAAPSESTSVAPSASPSPIPSEAPSPSPAPTSTPDLTPEPTLDPGTAGPGCGTGLAGFNAHSDELPPVLHFGGATIEFTTAGIGLRNGTFGADDVIPAGIGLSPNEIAVRVDPGTHIILRGAGMTITSLNVSVVPWSTVHFEGGLGSSAAKPIALDWRLRADGSISVSAPVPSGDYMVEFLPLWHTDCLAGDGVAYGRIKVN